MYIADNINSNDILFVLDNLRNEDKIEAFNTLGPDWKNITFNRLINSKQPFILAKTKKDDIPVLVAGAWCESEINNSVACIFMLSTPEIKNHQIAFLKEFKKELEKYDEKFALLYNFLYKENLSAKNWLNWAGFIFPANKKYKNLLDKAFLLLPCNQDFEVFYRERKIKGLGE